MRIESRAGCGCKVYGDRCADIFCRKRSHASGDAIHQRLVRRVPDSIRPKPLDRNQQARQQTASNENIPLT